jgi:phage N-6-adenine-methyltransferase
MKDTDEQHTPKWIFEALNVEFDLDVCAPDGGVEWIPAKKHYSLKDDSLNQAWSGMVWMNPPYSQPTQWVNKFIEHGNGIALLPYSKSAWFLHIWEKADGIIALTPRMKFVKSNGDLNSIFMPVCLVGIGSRSVTALKNCNLGYMR